MRGKNVSTLLVAFVILSSFAVLVTTLPENVRAGTLFVGGGGPGNYTTIQSAISVAIPGDTIYVYSGTYDGPISIDKTLSLKGEDKSTTIITASFGAVVITADWVNFSEFSINNAGNPITLISVQDCIITDIIIFGGSEGILLDSSNRNTISHGVIAASYGIRLDNSHRNLLNNNTMDNNNFGILLESSNENILYDNSILYARYGGISIRYSMYSDLKNNSFVGSGIDLQGWPVDTWNTHVIDASNTVNGRPVHYDKNATGGLISSPGGQVILANCTDMVVENQNSSESSIGIQFGFSSNNTVVNATISSNHLDGVLITQSYGNTIKNSTIVSNQGHGIFLNGRSGDNSIDDNFISTNDRSGIKFEHSDRFNSIINNTFYRNSENDVYLWYSSYNNITYNYFNRTFPESVVLEYSRRNGISHNYFNRTSRAIDVWYYGSNTITNNTAWGSMDGLMLWDSSANTIMDNHIIYGGDGISLVSDSRDNIIERNNISHASYGIVLDSSRGNAMTNNSLFSNQRGLEISYSDQIIVADNSIIDSTLGIYIRHSDFGTIQDNSISDSFYGIYTHYLDSSTLRGNTVSRNEYGMFINSSVGDIIIENTISDNVNGFFLYGSTGNSIYHNDILHNTNQAIDHSDANLWDNGYPSGGNYWSDYTDPDICSGPNQDVCPDPDGIGDTPYIIDADSRDTYPFAFPCSMQPRPPTLTGARLTGSNWENVTLSWSLSLDDGSVLGSVIGYWIYRNSSYDPEGLGYQVIDFILNGTTEYVDYLAGEGNSNNYFYRVCAIDLGSNVSCSRHQASKFTSHLVEGRNLVSFPLIQSNESVEAVLKTTAFDEAWFFDSNEQQWKSYMTSKTYHGELKLLNHTMGFWINAKSKSNLTVAGLVPLSTTINLRSGWNLIGYPAFDTTFAVWQLRGATGATRIEGFDSSASPYRLRFLWGFNLIETGRGYWANVPQDSILTLSNA